MQHLLDSFLLLLSFQGFFYCLLGVMLGIVVGAIPGLNGTMLITLSLPLTLYMDTELALVMLVAMYVGSVSGGQVSAILLRIPGTPAAVVTTLDGYPMARAGQPSRALALSISASLAGGVISWVFLVLLSPQLARWSINFGPWEFFCLMLMALVLIAAVSKGSYLKGLLSGFLGILVSLPGTDLASGVKRLTFGIPDLAAGFSTLPVLLGIFALGQIFAEAVNPSRSVERVGVKGFISPLGLGDWLNHGVNLVRSSVIGTFVGILPGIGASIASIFAYTTARNFSREPERFGQGSEEGIVASEAANNASVGGALVPLVAMGIPGSVIDAVLLGALIMHGFAPGPTLFTTDPGLVYAIVASCLVATIMMFVAMSGLSGLLVRLVDVPRHILLPAVTILCIFGALASGNKLFDVWVMLGFGVVGFVMIRCNVPPGPFIIGYILAPLAEFHLRAGLQSSGGSMLPLLGRPIAVAFLVLAVLLLLWPFLRQRRKGPGAAGEAEQRNGA